MEVELTFIEQKIHSICNFDEQLEGQFHSISLLMRRALRSPHGSIRLKCLRALLDSLEQSLYSDKMTQLFALLIEVEECPADFHNYRRRAQLLRRLKFDSFVTIFINNDENIQGLGKGSDVALLVLDWLLAQFYERFTLYWPLLIEPIESYARGIGFDGFWDCFEQALDLCWKMIFESNEEKTTTIEGGSSDLLNSFSPIRQLPPAYFAFRLQLLRLLLKLPIDIIKPEKRTNYLSSKFLLLYMEEFVQVDEFINNNSKVDNDLQRGYVIRPLNFHIRRSVTVGPLKAFLSLFCNFANPRGIYNEKAIQEIYYELLLANDPEIQRLALECLHCYKYSWLSPYRKSLERLLDEKYFRDQLVLFSVDSQQIEALSCEQHGRTVGKNSSNAIPLLDEHRKDFIPILLRLLYGSLQTHIPKRGNAKRTAIFRFLANCLSEELELFLQLMICPICSFFDSDDILRNISISKTLDNLHDIKKVQVQSLSLNKLKSVLGSLTDIFLFLGPSLNDGQTTFLFNTLLLSGKIIFLRDQWFMQNKIDEEISPVRQLKNLRLLFIETFIKFLQTFESRIISVTALETFFNEILSPLINTKGKIVEVTLRSQQRKSLILLPSSLIRMFCFWIKIPRYQPLLNVPLLIQFHKSSLTDITEKITPFSLLCDQLLIFNKEEKRIKSVHIGIVQAFCLLLNLSVDHIFISNENDLCLSLPQMELPRTETFNEDIKISFGVCLVLSKLNVSKILEHLSHFINDESLKTEQLLIARLPTIYFEFVNKLSSFIHDPEFGRLFASTLLQYITNKNGKVLRRQSIDKVHNLLSTFSRLSIYMKNPLIAIRLIGPLFSVLNGRSLREQLVEICSSLCANEYIMNEGLNLLKLIESLESWDVRRIAEPDADRRCEALLCLHDYYEREECDKLLVNGAHEFLPLLAHSHAYAMIHSSDISLRGISANCFRQLIIFISKQNSHKCEFFDSYHFLRSHLITLVIRGLQIGNDEKMEPVRQEFFKCLIQLMHSFPLGTRLTELREICYTTFHDTIDSNIEDQEMNFFECALHIQIHKRKHAFNQLAKRLNNEELKIGYLPLLQYIFPIIEPYFLENAPNRVALAEQALNLFTAILKRVPWHKYVKILMKYIRQINTEERVKQFVRVVIAILDGFHFDLRELEQPQKSTVTTNITDAENLIAKNEQKQILTTKQCKKEQIFIFVSGKLLPKLRELLRPQNQFNTHRRAQNFSANIYQHEDEKLLRAPLVLAIARLFKWLPQRLVHQNMNGCLLTLNHLLMSRSISIRNGARKLMINLVRIFGPSHFPTVIRELKQTMNKGYQIHVMVFTVHLLINAIAQDLQPGDLDACLKELVEIFKWEAFGNNYLEQQDLSQQDLQITQIRSESHGVPEAMTSNKKTADTLTQIGKFIGSEKALDEIVLEQIREIVEASPKAETIRKLSDWLRALSTGLRINSGGIPPIQQLNFSLILARKCMRYMEEDKERLSNTNFFANKIARRPPNCLLLPAEPKRIGVIHRVAVKSKMHIFLEFAFQILIDQLKGRSINTETENYSEQDEQENSQDFDTMLYKHHQTKEIIPLLEQFVPLLLESLNKKYDKVTVLSLRSIFYLFKWPLKSLKEHESELVDQLFIILNDYASHGHAANRPTIIELHQNLFKCFTHLLRNSPITSLHTERLQLLINYVENDILDPQKYTTAFNLVKAIIDTKIDDEKITNIIEYLSEKAITSPSTNIRSQCRQVIILYLINHPQGMRTYEQSMEFFLNQAEYDIVDGRLSALELINSILTEFTEEANDRYAMLVFLKLSARLQNDENEQCLQFIAVCLRKLFTSITASPFNDLYAATTDWLSSRKPSIRILAWRLFTQFVLSNSPHFTKHLLMKIIKKTSNEFCIDPFTFSSNITNDFKLSFCELFLAVADNMPEELFKGIFHSNDFGTRKSRSNRMNLIKTLKKHKSKHISIEGEGNKYNDFTCSLRFFHFIDNLEHCLLVVKQNTHSQSSERLKLSITAAKFLNTWIRHQHIREKLIPLLNNYSNKNRTTSDEIKSEFPQKTLLYSLCVCLISLLENFSVKDKESKTKIIKNETTESEENNLRKDNDLDLEEQVEEVKILLNEEVINERRRNFWDDALADLIIHLLTYFMLGLDIAKQFGNICRRLSKICWTEAIKEAGINKKRLCILKMIGVLMLKCTIGSEQFGHLCNYFLPLIYREMNDSSKTSEEKSVIDMQTLASEVGNIFRKQLGDREFSTFLSKYQRERNKRKQRRSEQAKAMLILDPATAIAVKQKRHLLKRMAKVRRLDELKPYRAFKRRRKEEASRRVADEE